VCALAGAAAAGLPVLSGVGAGTLIGGASMIAAATALVASGTTAQAQSSSVSSDTDVIASDAAASARFAGTRYELAPVAGVVAFEAERVQRWTDASGVQRLYLDGDARVTLGSRVFSARRAVVWMSGAQGGGPTQVFVRFDRLGALTDPVGAAGATGDRVSARAVVAARSVTATTRRMSDGPPSRDDADARALLGDAVAALERSLARAEGRADAGAGDGARRTEQAFPSRRPWPASATAPRVAMAAPDWRLGPVQGATGEPRTPGDTADGPGTRVASPVGPREPLVPARGTAPDRRTPPSPGEGAEGPSTPSTDERGGAARTGPVAADGGAAAPTGPAAADGGAAAPAPSRPAVGPRTIAGRDGIFVSGGSFSIAAGEVSLVSGDDQNALIVSGGVTIQYREAERNRLLQMSSQRAVVFLAPGPLASTLSLGADQVRGIYLEGEATATDGDYTLRAPQAYYDVQANRAVALDAVFWTYDARRGIPLYLRADTIRQESSRQFSGESVRFSNTGFFDPELSIGASEVTISRVDREVMPRGLDAEAERAARAGDQGAGGGGVGGAGMGGGGGGASPRAVDTRTLVRAEGVTPRVMGVPFFWFPVYEGDPEQQVIRDFRVENTSGSGGAVKATLNAFGLLGLDQPGDWSADLFTDFYFERGPALGTRVAWSMENTEGAFFAYGLPSDRGVDIFKSGEEVDRDGEARGMTTFEQRWRLSDRWTLFAEAALISDQAFVDAFFEGLGESRREFTNRLLARRLDENTSLSVDVRGAASSFVANEYLLQSRGYSVTKLPEISYVRIGDDLLPEPGLLSSFTELRASRMGLNFDEVLASERGLPNNALAQRALLLDANQRLSDRLRDQGFFEDEVYRVDGRQELSSKVRLGEVVLTPFAVGRVTAWDSSFEEFSPEQDESVRGWGALGLRASTTLTRVYDGVGSRLLDINRVRHVIEPNATVWLAGTNIEADELPEYDTEVEGLADGAAMRLGVTQSFQTKRGGPGRWHDADVLVVSTDFHFAEEDSSRRSPLTRWIEFRPELGSPGDAFVLDTTYNVTDAVAITGANIYDFDLSQNSYTSTGLMFRHSPEYFSAIDLRYLNLEDSTLVAFFTQYRLTAKYTVLAAADYDANDGGFQSFAVELRRQYSSLLLGLTVSYNDITGETSFGFVLRPYGVTGEARVVGLGADAAAAGGGGL
jgi:hypothetical protein